MPADDSCRQSGLRREGKDTLVDSGRLVYHLVDTTANSKDSIRPLFRQASQPTSSRLKDAILWDR